MISVLIAVNHTMFREGLKNILNQEEDISIETFTESIEDTIDESLRLSPDVILMDIEMMGIDGVEAIKRIMEIDDLSKIIVLTQDENKGYLFKILNEGAKGYVLKDADPSVFITAIRSVAKGNSFIQPNMTKELVKEFNKMTNRDKRSKYGKDLTNREIEVLELIAEGYLNREIASRLYISEKTVKNHVSSIFKKLNVTDRTQAAIYAIKHDIMK